MRHFVVRQKGFGHACYVFRIRIVTDLGGLYYYLCGTQTPHSRSVLNLSDYITNITCDIFGNRVPMVTKHYNVHLRSVFVQVNMASTYDDLLLAVACCNR